MKNYYISKKTTVDKKLLTEFEIAYENKDLIWTYELFNEIYEKATSFRLHKESKHTIKEMITAGHFVKLETLKTTLKGLIEFRDAFLN